MWDERISVVRAFADAITRRDLGGALEVCHPEIEFFSTMSQLEAEPRVDVLGHAHAPGHQNQTMGKMPSSGASGTLVVRREASSSGP